jgi:hypothetical protein
MLEDEPPHVFFVNQVDVAALLFRPRGPAHFGFQVSLADPARNGVAVDPKSSCKTVGGIEVPRPLFRIAPIEAPHFPEYASYAVLAIAAGLIATVLPQVFYRVRDFFRVLPIPLWTKPALGGLGVGLLALRLPHVLGGGYGWIQQAINGQLALRLLLVLVFAKMIARLRRVRLRLASIAVR